MTRLNKDFDDLDVATKYIRAAYKLGGEDVGALRPYELKNLAMYLVKSLSIISGYQNKKDSPKKDYDIIIKAFDKYYPLWRKGRTKEPIMARYCLFYFLREYTQLSLMEIAKRVGNDCGRRSFDHTTVIHAVETVRDMIDIKDTSYMAVILHMEAVIQDVLGILDIEKNYKEEELETV